MTQRVAGPPLPPDIRFLPVFASYVDFSEPGGRGAGCSPRAVRERGGSRLIIQRGC